jgi:uncharacterized membrane protein YkoI
VKKMIKKGLIALVAIVAAVGLVFAAYGDSENQTSNGSGSVQQPENDNSSEKTSTNSTIISATKAKQMAEKYIEEPGATAGTPELVKSKDKQIYLVPVIHNGKQVGEIEIDAVTGENLGGSGGAP